MTTKKTKTDKKGERKGKTSKKSSIRSPKKKPKIRIKELIDTKRRYLVVSAILLFCIVALALVAFGLFKKIVKLPFEHSVDTFQPLFFAKLNAIIGGFPHSRARAFSGRISLFRDRAFRPVTSLSFQKQLLRLRAAEPAH